MSALTINGYTLLAEPAEWDDNPTWKLAWDTEVQGTLRGNEGRSGLREYPRPTLGYSVQPMHIHRQAALLAALTEGLASGKCCAPTFGRASWLAGDTAAGSTALTIEPSAWTWSVNDWLLIYTSDAMFVTAQIAAIDAAGTTFTLEAGLTAACAGESAVYRLFFGRAELSDIDQTNGSISQCTITLVGDEFVIDPNAIPACCTFYQPGHPGYTQTADFEGETSDTHARAEDAPIGEELV